MNINGNLIMVEKSFVKLKFNYNDHMKRNISRQYNNFGTIKKNLYQKHKPPILSLKMNER